MKNKNMANLRFGRWLVLSLSHVDDKGNAHWLCRCDCGQESVVPGYRLRRGASKSCGCLRAEETFNGIPLDQFVSPDSAVEWRPIAGFEGKYWVSADGRVFSTARPCLLVQTPDHSGYPKVGLRTKDRELVNFSIHVLVARAFLGDKPEGLQINHKDGIKTHNHWTNLEYVTCQENVQHAISLGLRKRAAA